MRLRSRELILLFLGMLAHGCQTPQFTQTNRNSSETAGAKPSAAIFDNAERNEKYDSIETGMSREMVIAILGRKPDQCVRLGGSLGDQECRWFEKNATISVVFDWGSEAREKKIRQN